MTTEPRKVNVAYYGKKYLPLPPLSNVNWDSLKETPYGDRQIFQHVDNQNGQAYDMTFRIYNTEETDTQKYGQTDIDIFVLDCEESLNKIFELCSYYECHPILLLCVTNKDFELTPSTKEFMKCIGQLLGGMVFLEYEHDETKENMKLKETIDVKTIIDLAKKKKPSTYFFKYLIRGLTELQEDNLPRDITMANFQRMGMDAYGYYDKFIIHLALIGHVFPACTWWSVSSPKTDFRSNSDILFKAEATDNTDDLYERISHVEGDIHSLYLFEQDCNSIIKIIGLLTAQQAPIRHLIIISCIGTLSFNFLSSFPEGLKYLVVLDNRVTLASLIFPPQIVSSLRNLVLNLCYNNTKEVPSNISKLENLEVLDLRNNNFNKLPLSFSNLDTLEHLLIDKEKIVSPPRSILKKSARGIVQYLKEIQAKPVTANREAKVMVVGQEGVGKSTFVKSLKRTGIRLLNTTPPTKTDGIEISNLHIKDTDCKVYDLAGDVEYLNTHPLFFSPNCLHLAVFDLSNVTVNKESRSTDQFGRLELWLQTIASQDPLSYAIIVGTHADHNLLSPEVLANIRRSLFDILLKYRSPHQSCGTLSTYEECMICNPMKIPTEVSSSLPERAVSSVVTNTESETTSSGIPHILGYFEVSGITNKNVKSLKRKLESSTKDIKSYTKTDNIPERWLHLRKSILNKLSNEDQLRQEPLLPMATIEEMANDYGIFTNDSIVAMLRFFYSQGDFLWYEEIPEMKDVVIVDPQWLSDQLRTLISHLPSVNAVCEGVLYHSHLPDIWCNMSEENRTRLLTLFRSVGLCFSISDDKDMFPCKLPVGWPDREMWPPLPDENQTSLLFEFSFVPSQFFPDLIVAINKKQASFPQKVRPLYYRFNAVYITKQQGQCYLHAGIHKGSTQACAAGSEADAPPPSFHRVHMELTPHSNSLKCKMWGLLLRNMFGQTLGTGDYGHFTIEHSSMLFRVHGSFRKYSNQGFEASHKQHRMLYSRSTNHDCKGEAESLKQILTHWYSEKLLSIRYQFVKAKEFVMTGKTMFYYRGCGWKNQFSCWSKDDKIWIFAIVYLFEQVFGQDFLKYVYDANTGTKIATDNDPRETFEYRHDEWEERFPQTLLEIESKSSKLNLTKSKVRKNALKLDDDDDDEDDEEDGLAQCCVLKGITPIVVDDNNDHDDDNMESETSQECSVNNSDDNCDGDENAKVKSESDSQISSCQQPECIGQQSHPVTFDTIPVNPELLKSKSVTRGQLASVILPTVSSNVTSSAVHLLFTSNVQFTNPYDLKERPSEAVLREIKRKMTRCSPSAITIGCLGTFNIEGIEVLLKFCNLSKLKYDVKAEIEWVAKDTSFSEERKSLIENFLWNNNMSAVICRHHHKIIDVEAFQAFPLERYLDNMSIDVCISHYLEKSSTKVSTLYVPFEAWTWINALSDNELCDNLKKLLQDIDSDSIEQVIMIVHFQTKQHWGLIVAQIEGHVLYFDDGYNSKPPRFALRGMCRILNLLQQVLPDSHKYFWDYKNVPVMPFGMDNQRNASRTSGNGSGSCGLGVILAAKDFITNGVNAVNKMSWQFKDTQASNA